MVLKEFPQGKKIKQLKRVNASSYWRKIILVLAFLFLSFFSWKILVGLSEPSWEEEKANIQSVNEAGQVSGMTAYQYDFRDSPPQPQPPSPPSKKNIAQTDTGLNIKGAKSAEVGGQGYNLGAAPDGDVQLPFNLFFPGRGQKDSQNPTFSLLGEEIDPRTNERVWKFNNSDIPIGDAANIPSIQRINAEMLDLIWGTTTGWHRQRGYNGIVFGNDVPNPQIVVARFRYDIEGNARVYGYKIFPINSAPTNYEHGLLSKDMYLTGNTPIDELPTPNENPLELKYPGGVGWLHDIHFYKGIDGKPKFLVTIINWGVFEFGCDVGGGNFNYTGWRYVMPTFGRLFGIYNQQWQQNPGINYHPEMSTIWYAQPLDTNNDNLPDRILMSVAPWKSFKYANGWDLMRPFPKTENGYGPYNVWTNPGTGKEVEGYPSDNNTPENSSFAPTHIIEINYSSSPSEREYPNGILVSYSKKEDELLPNNSSRPGSMNQIHPCFWGLDGKIYANNNNFMQVGTPPDTNAGGTCFGSAGKPPLYYIESLYSQDQYFQGPRIWSGDKNPNNNPSSPPVRQDIATQDLLWYRTLGGGTYYYFRDPPDNDSSCKGAPKGYSETLFQLPKTNLFFVNYYNYYVNSYLHSGDLTYETRQGYPAVIYININSNYSQILWQWNKPAYVHMGAGTYAAYGTKRPESWSSDIVGQSLNAITDMRDGGLASQLAPPPHDSYVRDFEFMRTVGVDAKNSTNLFGQSQLAYALADENKNIFRSPKGPRYNSNNPNSNPLNYANVNIDLNNFAEDFVNNNPNPQPNTGLEKYQQIWLTALMWGDVGSGLNQFQRSNTPILKAWGINYKDKTAKFEPTLTATTGKDPDPRNYTSDGVSQFYTGKDHNQVRYKLTATNDNGNLTWPANNIQIKINPDSKESLNTNQVYYRIRKKATNQKLKIRAKGDYYLGWPRMRVMVNGQEVGSVRVDSAEYKDYEFNVYPTTDDCVDVIFDNDASRAGVGDRNLYVQSITVNNAISGGEPVIIMYNNPGVVYDRGAEDNIPSYYDGIGANKFGDCWKGKDGRDRCWNTDRLSWNGALRFPGKTRLTVNASGRKAQDNGYWPKMKTFIDDNEAIPMGFFNSEVEVDSGFIGNLSGDVYCNPPNVRSYIYYFTPSNKTKVKVKFTNNNQGRIENDLCVTMIGLKDNLLPNGEALKDCIKIDNASNCQSRDCGMSFYRWGTILRPYNPGVCPVIGPQSCSLCCLNYPNKCPREDETCANNCCNWRCIWENSWGGWTFWNSEFIFPETDTLGSSELPWEQGAIDRTGRLSLPSDTILEQGETIEIIYTTTIQRAGKINHKTTLFFNNRGNTVQAPAVEKSCTGNAPWVQTLYGDVYLGGGVHPYFAYGNATFLIQTGTDSLTNFTSNKPGWLQRSYPLADELKLSGEKGVVAKIKRNIEVSKGKGELRRWIGGDNIINSLNNTDKKGYYYEGDLTISGGNLYKNKGAKLIAIYGNLTITGDIKYYGETDPADVNNLACLGIVVFGNLNISPSVGRLDGVYFVNGTINTCASATPSACDKQLVSYGLWVARGFLLNRTFVGEVNDPAEKIIYDGRIALNPPVGLSDFGRLFPVWKEVAP